MTTRAYDIAVGTVVDTTGFVTTSDLTSYALASDLDSKLDANSTLNPANLDTNGTIPSALLAGVGGEGGLVPLGQIDSSGTVSDIYIDNVFSTTYKNYLVIVDEMHPDTNGANIKFRLRDDVPNSINSGYSFVSRSYRANDNGLNSANGDNQSSITVTDNGVSSNSTRNGLKMAMWVHNPFESTVKTSGHGTFEYLNAGGHSVSGTIGFTHDSNASPRGLHFFTNTGSINGRIKIYGVADS